VRVHLVYDINSDEMWDTIALNVTSPTRNIEVWRRDVFVGQDHELATKEALGELEVVLRRVGWHGLFERR
jgi:hypothetical protein